MADTFAGIEIAVIIVTASIVLAGIMIGIGRATGYKRVEIFGIEELVQSIINAAIIGSFAAIIELVGVISSSVVSQSCSQGNVITQLSCSLDQINVLLFSLLQELTNMLNILGFYQTLTLDFGAFSLSPFHNLAAVSNTLGLQLLSINWIMILISLNSQIATFIGQNALGLLFPVGLILRTFFATRKVGGFLIALAIGLFVFYPTFILVFPGPQNELNNTTAEVVNFTNNSYYATTPVVDLSDNYAIAGKIDVLSGKCDPKKYNVTNGTNVSNTTTKCDDFLKSQLVTTQIIVLNTTQNYSYDPYENVTIDFSSDITKILQNDNTVIAKALLYSVIAPIFSLIITVVFVRELANILGSEIGLKSFASI